ncbi:MAG: pyruvate dehydrogenase (acetyl-transferring) E1 component subunit alpha [Pseudomonadota bacterium]
MQEYLEIPYSQCLNEQGEIVGKLPEFAKNAEEAIKLYQLLVLLRTFDTKAVALQRTGKIGTYAGILGQEAVSVGLGAAMQMDDVLCPAYREYGAMIQRGGKLEDILLYWGGDERGSDFQHPEDFPISVPIASQCLHAAGVAIAFKHRKQKRAAVAVVGDGGTSKGDFYEAINLAGEWRLPVVFVINNNQWAISLPRTAQTAAKTLAQKAVAAGFSGIQVDGNDVIAVRDVCAKALKNARENNEPMIIEALTYRLCDHTTADDAKRYRENEELQNAKAKEPLIRLRQYLTQQNLWNEEEEKKLLKSCSEKVELAVKNFQNTPARAPETIFDKLYHTLPKAYAEQFNAIKGAK